MRGVQVECEPPGNVTVVVDTWRAALGGFLRLTLQQVRAVCAATFTFCTFIVALQGLPLMEGVMLGHSPCCE